MLFFQATHRNISDKSLVETKEQYHDGKHHYHTSRNFHGYGRKLIVGVICEQIQAVRHRRVTGDIQKRSLIIVPVRDKAQQEHGNEDRFYQGKHNGHHRPKLRCAVDFRRFFIRFGNPSKRIIENQEMYPHQEVYVHKPHTDNAIIVLEEPQNLDNGRRCTDNRQHHRHDNEGVDDFTKNKLIIRRNQIRYDTRGNRTYERRTKRVKQGIRQHI